jgi:hypothetical protein
MCRPKVILLSGGHCISHALGDLLVFDDLYSTFHFNGKQQISAEFFYVVFAKASAGGDPKCTKTQNLFFSYQRAKMMREEEVQLSHSSQLNAS